MNLKMIQEKPKQSLVKFMIPSVIAMLLSSLITIVDGAFIGQHVGKAGLAAINLGLPIIYLFLGVAIMISVGGSTIAIQQLGDNNCKEACRTFNQTILMLLSSVFLLSIACYALFGTFQGLLSISEPVIRHMSDYYHIMLLVYPIMMLNIAFGMFVRGEGKPELFMKITILTNLINVVLDGLFISQFHMGVKGAAYASLISVLTGSLLFVIYFVGDKSKFKFQSVKMSKDVSKTILLNGSSELIGQVSIAITLGLLNTVILSRLGIVGVAAMTVIGYAGYIYNMIIIGMGQGMSPLTSFMFGAKDYATMHEIKRITQGYTFVAGVILLILTSLFGNAYARMFSDSIELISLIKSGLALYTFGFLVAGYNIIASFYFTSIGKAKESALISSLRGLILLSLCIIALPYLLGDVGIWLVYPITEAVTLAVSIYLIRTSQIEADQKHFKNIEGTV